MPFDKTTAATAGRKGGSRTKDPATARTKYLPLRVSPDELALIDHKAASANVSRTELVVRAVREYEYLATIP